MIRSWQVGASAHIEIDGEVYPVVTQDDMLLGLRDLAVAIDRLGGCGTIVPRRIATGMPNEMVTIGAVVTYMDRTNAKARPEPDARQQPPEPDVGVELAEAAVAEEPEPAQNGSSDGHRVLPFGEQGPGAVPDVGVALPATEPVPDGAPQPFVERYGPERVVTTRSEDGAPVPISDAEAASLDGLTVDPNAVDESNLPPALRQS